MKKYDCIIIGAGHAGIEAAAASARLGVGTLLVTLSLDTIGKLSCNPAIGGVAKGHLVREVDALGGLIGKITDTCGLNYRILNKSKGKAVWATRAQVDMVQYSLIARKFLEQTPGLEILETKINKILVKNKKIYGVETNFGEVIASRAVIMCAGTFLKSIIHIGMQSFPGGRLAEGSSDELFDSLKKYGHHLYHFKTGTCARLDKRSLDCSGMIPQGPDYETQPFSFFTEKLPEDQRDCFITYTNAKTHRIILKNLKYSPLYRGKIKARGVRYCPSLEDKIVKFRDHDRHQIFIEPCGRESIEIYPNGLSTSLPFDVQLEFIHSIEGLRRARMLKPGYGIEHGCIDARELSPTLESKLVRGLYCAGQVNGTTGYEEAAAQGCIAGINAALMVQHKKPFILRRQDAFTGVLIDDLTLKGTDEPYRMFTSRSEFRLTLRESNADVRLGPLARQLGLISDDAYERVKQKKDQITRELARLRATRVIVDGATRSLYDFFKRPQTQYEDLLKYCPSAVPGASVRHEVEIEVKYEGFLRREAIWLGELKNLDKIKIPLINYKEIASLSREVVEKLTRYKPRTLAQALAISGITPAAITSLYMFIRTRQQRGKGLPRNARGLPLPYEKEGMK